MSQLDTLTARAHGTDLHRQADGHRRLRCATRLRRARRLADRADRLARRADPWAAAPRLLTRAG